MPWGGQRVCHSRAGGTAPLTTALLLCLAGKDGETPRELQPDMLGWSRNGEQGQEQQSEGLQRP